LTSFHIEIVHTGTLQHLLIGQIDVGVAHDLLRVRHVLADCIRLAMAFVVDVPYDLVWDMNAVSRIAVIICAAPFTNTITMRSIQKCVKSYFRVDTIYFVGYIRYMEKTIKYHIELTEEEDGMLYALATAYSKKFA